MLEVVHVAIDQRGERNGFLAADDADQRQVGRWNGADDVQQMAVEKEPEVHQVRPGLGGVGLDGHPGFLVVIGKVEASGDAGADQALVVVAGGIDQVAENLLFRPSAGRGDVGDFVLGEIDQAARGGLEDAGQAVRGGTDMGGAHLSTTLARPVLLALSATRMTSRCSPGARPLRSSTKFSCGESMTPSAASTGTQLEASSEYSQRRRGEAASEASNSTWAVPEE